LADTLPKDTTQFQMAISALTNGFLGLLNLLKPDDYVDTVPEHPSHAEALPSRLFVNI
jgi:hypothetical protein